MSGIRTRLHHLADHYLILALLCSLTADTSTCSIKVLILLDTKNAIQFGCYRRKK